MCTLTFILLLITDGPISLLNITSLVAEDQLEAADVLLRLYLLDHIGIDITKILGRHRDNTIDAYCPEIQRNVSDESMGKVSDLMNVNLSRILGDDPTNVSLHSALP